MGEAVDGLPELGRVSGVGGQGVAEEEDGKGGGVVGFLGSFILVVDAVEDVVPEVEVHCVAGEGEAAACWWRNRAR